MNKKATIKEERQEIVSTERILLALELGRTDETLLNYLDFLAGTFKVTDVAIYHVIPKVTLMGNELKSSPVLGDFKINNEVIKALTLEIENQFKGHKDTDVVFDIREGDPLEQLINEDKLLEPDIVMVGKNPSTSSHGIMVKNIVRRVQAHTWIVPKGAPAKIKHILVPIDFSPNSIRALKAAVEFRDKINHPVKITAIHVYDTPDFSAYKIGRNEEQLNEMIRENKEEAALNFITSNVGEHEKINIVLQERKKPGVGHYIRDYAETKNVNLIIMGAKGHSKVELLLMGSVTEKVISLDHQIPILVVK